MDIITYIYNKKNNALNEELTELRHYLMDMLMAITQELQQKPNLNTNVVNAQKNWRMRKNPDFIKNFKKKSNIDPIYYEINMELNKISSANYVVIADKINELIAKTQDRKNVCIYILENTFINCLNQPNQINSILSFLDKLECDEINDNMNIYIDNFVKLLEAKDIAEVNTNYIYTIANGNVAKFVNIGTFFALQHKMMEYNVYSSMYTMINNTITMIEWAPYDIELFDMRINIAIGFFTVAFTNKQFGFGEFIKYFETMKNNINIPAKIKYRIIDLYNLGMSKYNFEMQIKQSHQPQQPIITYKPYKPVYKPKQSSANKTEDEWTIVKKKK